MLRPWAVHDRLVANDPEGCAKAEANRERRLAANMPALECEQTVPRSRLTGRMNF